MTYRAKDYEPKKFVAQIGNERYEVLVPNFFVAYWESKRGPGAIQLMLDQFVSCDTFTDAAEQLGVTRERVRQIYLRFFAPYLPAKDGRERRMSCTIGRKLSEHARPLTEMTLAYVLAKGLDAKRLFAYGRHGPRIRKSHLRIGGYTCIIRRSSTAYHTAPGSLVTYFHANRPGGRWDYAIFVCGPAEPYRWFIIPSREIKDHGAFLPAGPATDGYTEWSPFRKYEDAWHLLGGFVDGISSKRNESNGFSGTSGMNGTRVIDDANGKGTATR